jgi:aspartate/methionine/tyrosine aminotransferase
MIKYSEIDKNDLLELKKILYSKYNDFKVANLKLDMTRGKPSSDQLDLSMDMLECVSSSDSSKTEANFDCRNYGLLDGTPEIKAMFAEMLEVEQNEVIAGGNSSLNMMYDMIARCFIFGASSESEPWGKLPEAKFLCPVPGYDRHFAICEQFGIKMIPIEMDTEGPDMDTIESLVKDDDSIKGIWCNPKYSNPNGITYSDKVVDRFAAMQTKASDFRIFWDNAYVVHDLYNTSDSLKNLMSESKKHGTEDRVLIFASTSKITFPSAGVAAMACSIKNVEYIKNILSIQTIGSDKLNQLRHTKFLKNINGIKSHMQKHAKILKPKFAIVTDTLDAELNNLEIASWSRPNGGYFISLDTLEGCAKAVISMAKEAGVIITPAGSTYPYKNDPSDRNIRIAPTFPAIEELQKAIDILCICIKIVSIDKLL